MSAPDGAQIDLDLIEREYAAPTGQSGRRPLPAPPGPTERQSSATLGPEFRLLIRIGAGELEYLLLTLCVLLTLLPPFKPTSASANNEIGSRLVFRNERAST